MSSLSLDSPLAQPFDLKQPLEIPPASPTHPIRWRRILKLMKRVKTSDDPVTAALELFDAVGGIGGEKTFERFVNRPEGRRLLRTKPDLVSMLGDREALAALPDGSLGRAYLAFAERNGFAADNLVEMTNTVEREREPMDPHRQWFWDRFTMSHDLWHVMTNCETDNDGEIRLLAFSFAQTPQRGYAILLGLSALSHLLEPRFFARQFKAWRAGRRAHDLVAAPWENYLSWPLDEVRQGFAVEELNA